MYAFESSLLRQKILNLRVASDTDRIYCHPVVLPVDLPGNVYLQSCECRVRHHAFEDAQVDSLANFLQELHDAVAPLVIGDVIYHYDEVLLSPKGTHL